MEKMSRFPHRADKRVADSPYDTLSGVPFLRPIQLDCSAPRANSQLGWLAFTGPVGGRQGAVPRSYHAFGVAKSRNLLHLLG